MSKKQANKEVAPVEVAPVEVEQVPIRTKASAATVRRITVGTKKARKDMAEVPANAVVEESAVMGVMYLRELLGTETLNNGKLSPFGHQATATNGLFDRAILASDTVDFAQWIKFVIQNDPKTRKSDVNDNNALLKRLGSHLKTLAGTKKNSLDKALARVGKADLLDEVHGLCAPLLVLFNDYVDAGSY